MSFSKKMLLKSFTYKRKKNTLGCLLLSQSESGVFHVITSFTFTTVSSDITLFDFIFVEPVHWCLCTESIFDGFSHPSGGRPNLTLQLPPGILFPQVATYALVNVHVHI